MSLQALQNKPSPLEERVIEFKGLNRKASVDSGEMADMLNMSCDLYPTLTQRKARGLFSEIPLDCTKVQDLMERRDPTDSRTKLAVVGANSDGVWRFWYDGTMYDISLSGKEKMVAVNNYICFFPSKQWFNVGTKDFGSMGYFHHNVSEDYLDGIENPAEDYMIHDYSADWIGRVLIDPQDQEHLYLMVSARGQKYSAGQTFNGKFSELKSMVRIGDVVRLSGDFVGLNNKKVKAAEGNEGVLADDEGNFTAPQIPITVLDVLKIGDIPIPTFNYTAYDGETGDPFDLSEALGTKGTYEGIFIKFSKDEFSSVTAYISPCTASTLMNSKYTGFFAGHLKVERVVPELDFFMEWNNRLWGVSNKDNTIYASKLGDPMSWDYYQNTSMDSYYAQQGTNGNWTGCAVYSSHLLFFKENFIHRVYGSAPSSFQTSIIEGFGVEEGSSESIATVNNMIFYKSPVGIMCYEGGNPYSISEKFGDWKYDNVVSGSRHKKYYASIHMKGGGYKVLVCDTGTGLWHIEDTVGVHCFRNYKNKLLMVDNAQKNVLVLDAEDFDIAPVKNDEPIPWSATFGPFDEYIENQKIYSKLQMRVQLPETATLKIEIAMNALKLNDCKWETIKEISAENELSVHVPIVPRRCSRFYVRLTGVGRCRIDSFTRKYRQGSSRVVKQ